MFKILVYSFRSVALTTINKLNLNPENQNEIKF